MSVFISDDHSMECVVMVAMNPTATINASAVIKSIFNNFISIPVITRADDSVAHCAE